MIVGLLFIAIIWCLRGFLSYKQVVHNSCNMGTRGLPDIYTLSPRACGPRALGVYIRQTTRAHVTTIYCMDHVSFLQMLPTQQIFRKPPDTSRLAGQCRHLRVHLLTDKGPFGSGRSSFFLFSKYLTLF